MPERSQGADCRRKRNKTDRFHVENGLFYVPSSLYGPCGGKYRRTPGRSALAEKNRGLFGWIADKVNEITGRINDAYDEIDLSDDIGVYEAARIFQRSENEIRERWNKLLVTANENKQAEQMTGKKISAENGRVQNMAWNKPRFEKSVDDWISKGKKRGRNFFVGTTSAPLHSVGVPNMGIRWTSGSMLHSQNLHPEISDTVLKQVPDILERPIVIMESNTQVNSLTMLGEVYGENHIPVMAALYLDLSPDGLSVEEIGISNAYTKTREDAPPSI